MIKRNLTSKITAAITSTAMLLSYCNLTAFANSDLTSSVFSYENYDITYSFTNHWSDKYQGSIFVKNTSEETIHDWCLAFVSDTSYEQIWNGVIENYDNIVLIHNKTYNQDILPGETVEVGFIETSEEAVAPDRFELISEPSKSPSENYSTEFKVEQDWATGYNASLTITNLSDDILEDWTIEFDWDRNIDTIWDAEIVDHSNFHYVITNASYNQNIEPGGYVKIGLQSNVVGGVETQPGNVNLTEYGSVRRDTINTLLNVRNISMDLAPFEHSVMGHYIVKNEVDSINGTIKPGIIATSADYSIETNWGKTLVKGEFAPESHWTIPDIGFVLGMNKVTVNVEFSDGTRSTESEWFCNYNENNMKNLNIDESDPDGDGLSNYLEEMYGTDPELKDTDGDGLTDYQELVDTGTNPLVIDTDNDGILDGRDDFDRDGIDTITEYEFGTNPLCIDTDFDELTDSEELYTYNTDPLKKDTDNDGAEDKWEIDNGYDPLTPDTFQEKTEVIEGIGNTAEITVHTEDGSAITLNAEAVTDSPYINCTIPGYTGSAFDFNMDGEFTSADLKITFDSELLNDEDFYPVIYYFNEETQQYEEIETEWDGVSNYVTAKLQHFSTYILLNKVEFDKAFNRDLILPSGNAVTTPFEFVFAIDSSASMIRNDAEGIRLDVAKDFIDKMKNTDKAQVFAFDDYIHSYTTSFISDKTALKNAISKVGNNGNWTYIGSAIKNGLSLFPTENNGAKRYLILLTDGIAQDSLPSDYVQTAKSKQVQIITIGLSNNVNKTYLQNIARNTAPAGGKTLYYFAEKNTDLRGTMDDLEEDINEDDPYKDSNDDGITDAQTKAFCNGTLTTSSGVNPFLGYTYEQVQANDDFDGDGLRNGDEIIIDKYAKRASEVRMISNPSYDDYDCDGMNDAQERKKYTDPFVADFDIDDIDTLADDDLYLSSIFSNDYLDNYGLKAQLFFGNGIFGFNIDYVDDYMVALSKYFEVGAKTQMEMEALEYIKSSMLEDKYSILKDILTYLQTAEGVIEKLGDGTIANNAKYLKTISDIERYGATLASLEANVRHMDSLMEAEGVLTEYLAKKIDLLAYIDTVDTQLSRAMDAKNANITGRLTEKLQKFTCKIPNEHLQKISKGLTGVYYATIVLDTAIETVQDVGSMSAIYSSGLEYEKALELTDVIINNSKNTELITAAANIRSALNSNINQFVNNAYLISEDIVRGTERIAYTTAVLASENPWVWAVDAGIWLGDAVWNTSSVDKQALSTIALGDTSACFSKYIYTKLYNDSGNYYHIYNDNFYLLSVFCQLRIVAENEFKATTDSYSWLYDLLTDIKDSSDDACRGTINIVKGIANRYGKILICEPNYDGAKVNV